MPFFELLLYVFLNLTSFASLRTTNDIMNPTLNTINTFYTNRNLQFNSLTEQNDTFSCVNTITQIFFLGDSDYILELINYSGYRYDNLGDETECDEAKYNNTNKKLQYTLLHASLNITELSMQFDDGKVMKYVNNSEAFIGICLIKSCISYIPALLSKKEEELQEIDKIIFNTIKTILCYR